MSSLRPAKDQPFASRFPRGSDSSEQSSSAVPATILLVEDNPTDVFVITEVIEACGLSLKLLVTRDGQEAIRYLQNLARVEEPQCPVLVLLDLNLPKVDGIEVLRRLRSDERCNHTPVIVVTSSTAEADRAAVKLLGAEAYFQKPPTLAAYMELGHLIRRVLAPGA